MKKTTIALGTAATLALAAGALALPTFDAESAPAVVQQEVAAVDLEPTTYDPTRSLAPLVEAVEPAVVAIEVEGTREVNDIPPMLRQFMDGPQRRPVRGEGSGFVISSDGLLLTNHHVIDNADVITVRFADGRTAVASLIGSDAENDVALLQLPKDRKWPHVELGASDEARVGDWVVAVGNPLGLGTSVTTGIISGKGRNLGDNPFHAFLQTDAAINRGNSGGPLFGLDGKVLGMNTAIIQYANTIGFAVPSDTLKSLVEDLKDDGEVQRGFVGIALQPVDVELGLAMGLDRARGAMITGVQPGLPGERAGLLAGDIITQVGASEVVDVNDAIQRISAHRPGQTVSLQVIRDGKARNVRVKLAQRGERAVASAPVESRLTPSADQLDRLGVKLRPGRAANQTEAGVDVLGVLPGSAAWGRLQPGDRIISANKVAVSSTAELVDVLDATAKTVVLDVRRQGRRVFVAISLPPPEK